MPDHAGQPTKYRTQYCKPARALCELGATDIELAEYFDVSIPTIWRWRNEHKEFFKASKDGKSGADARVVQSLFSRASGYSHPDVEIKVVSRGEGVSEVVEVPVIKHYPPDPTSMIFWLKNRQPKEWRDKTETVLSDPNGKGAFESMAIEIAKALAKGK